MIAIPITILPHGRGLPLPAYATPGAAGMDAVAAVAETRLLMPGERWPVPLGFCMAIPPGHEVQVRPRSGLALKHGITVPNSPGTIDADYRGEVMALLINLGSEAFAIERGLRICQLVPAVVTRAQLQLVDALDMTQRGAGGFGSTGVGPRP
jgi:dUTP pyrophosphatase